MKNKTSSASIYSGAGGAHIGFFGRPRILMTGEDSGGGGAGGGAPPPAPAPAPPPSSDPAGTAPPAAGFSAEQQQQVNLIVQKRLEEDRARRPNGAAPPAPAPKAKDEPVSIATLQAKYEALELRASFDKRATRMGLDDDTADELFDLYKAQRPEDPAAWFEKKSKVFKLTSATNATVTPQGDPTKTPPALPSGPPISDKGSPAPASVDFERTLADNPFGFGGVDKERLIAKHGKEKGTRMWMEAAERKAGSIKVTI